MKKYEEQRVKNLEEIYIRSTLDITPNKKHIRMYPDMNKLYSIAITKLIAHKLVEESNDNH